MARYYEENALIEFVKQYTPTINGETTMKCVERAIHNAPTADVVPKSEVERLYYNLQAVLEERAETKQEIAREIFEEIEDVLNNIGYFDELDFKALKKKYTEVKDGHS